MPKQRKNPIRCAMHSPATLGYDCYQVINFMIPLMMRLGATILHNNGKTFEAWIVGIFDLCTKDFRFLSLFTCIWDFQWDETGKNVWTWVDLVTQWDSFVSVSRSLHLISTPISPNTNAEGSKVFFQGFLDHCIELLAASIQPIYVFPNATHLQVVLNDCYQCWRHVEAQVCSATAVPRYVVAVGRKKEREELLSQSLLDEKRCAEADPFGSFGWFNTPALLSQNSSFIFCMYTYTILYLVYMITGITCSSCADTHAHMPA